MNAAPSKEKLLKEQALRDTASGRYMLKLILTLIAVLVFYGVLLINIIIVKADIHQFSGGAPYDFKPDSITPSDLFSLGFLILMGNVPQIKIMLGSIGSMAHSSDAYVNNTYNELMTLIDVLMVVVILALLVRLIPIISCIAVYNRGRRYQSLATAMPFMKLLKAFAVTETAVWSIIAGFFTVSLFKSNFHLSDDSVTVMIFVIFVLTLVCKIIQGIFLFKFTTALSQHLLTSNYPSDKTSGLKLSAVLLCTCFSILLFFILFVIARSGGWNGLTGSFQYLWKIYLFLTAYLLSNGFLVSLLKIYTQRSERTVQALTVDPAKMDPGTYQNPWGAVFYQAPQAPQPSYRPDSSPQSPQAYQSDSFPQEQNASDPAQKPTSAGSSYSGSFEDMFGFRDPHSH